MLAFKACEGNPKTRCLLLRKDFIIDEYQLYEALAYGADTCLLMVSILDEQTLGKLIAKARELSLEPLVEVVNESELDAAVRCGAKVIGVNNRNLHTFKVDMGTTPRMVDYASEKGYTDLVFAALSGVKTPADVSSYKLHGGISMVLVGETLMRATDPGSEIRVLLGKSTSSTACRVKVCGICDVESAEMVCRSGADFLGIIFAPKSKRCVTVGEAKRIVEAVRSFREMDGAIQLTPQTRTLSRWGDAIGSACDGQARPLVVGVFMDQSLEEVNEIAQASGIDLIQLHGNESVAFAKGCCRPVVRVVHVEKSLGDAKKLLESVEHDAPKAGYAAILLDTSIKGGSSGGTGVTFDWAIAAAFQNHGIPVIVAGGLNPSNVDTAIKASRPWGVDVASGVEHAPRVKDPEKIVTFVRAAKAAAQ